VKKTTGAPLMGQLVRRLRVRKGLRLEDLARNTGFTKGFLSKIENGKSSPPIATLLRVAEALDVDAAVLLQPPGGNGSAKDPHASLHVTPARRTLVENRGTGYDYFALAARRLHKAMEPFLITVRPEDVNPRKTFQHPGEEFIFVLEGRMDYKVGQENFHLGPGDSLYFDSSRPHAPLPKKGLVTFLAVFYAPPRLERGKHSRE